MDYIMNTDRLQLLADKLREDAKDPTGVKFDLKVWASSEDNDFEVGCNTFACAVGLACLTPEFHEQGLSYEVYPSHKHEEIADGDTVNTVIKNTFEFEPKFEDRNGFDAVHKFFGISSGVTDALFLGSFYDITEGADAENAVANRIELAIKTWKKTKDMHSVYGVILKDI